MTFVTSEPCIGHLGLDSVVDTGIVVAMRQIPPHNINWMKQGKWVHWAKEAYEKYLLKAPGIERLK